MPNRGIWLCVCKEYGINFADELSHRLQEVFSVGNLITEFTILAFSMSYPSLPLSGPFMIFGTVVSVIAILAALVAARNDQPNTQQLAEQALIHYQQDQQ